MAPLWRHSLGEGKPSQDGEAERHPASVALLLSVLVSLYIFFLPTFGPLLDHHFVEKAPNHAHVYLGHSGPDHTHPFETRHGHHEATVSLSAKSSGLSDLRNGTDGIVFLAPHEGTGQSAGTTMLTVAPASIVFHSTGDLFRFGLAGDDNRLLTAFVDPPRRPPRA
jgi:hypothetical protein